MADPFLEISRTLREEQFDRYAAYRVDGIEYPPAQDIMAIGFRKDKYESDDGGFKGYGDPKPIGKRPSRVPKIDYDKKWLKDDVVEFAKPKIWVSDPLPKPSFSSRSVSIYLSYYWIEGMRFFPSL